MRKVWAVGSRKKVDIRAQTIPPASQATEIEMNSLALQGMQLFADNVCRLMPFMQCMQRLVLKRVQLNGHVTHKSCTRHYLILSQLHFLRSKLRSKIFNPSSIFYTTTPHVNYFTSLIIHCTCSVQHSASHW